MAGKTPGIVPVWLLLLALAAAPGFGGWLVLDGGERIEIVGEWRVEGQLVLFHRVDGMLASLPVASVDLEASRAVERAGEGRPGGRRQGRRERTTSRSGHALLSRDEEISALVRAWARAWSNQDVEAYLSFYSRSFEPADSVSRAEWARARRHRLTAPRFIDVDISGLGTVVDSGGRARAMFRQRYRSNTYRDSVAKTLELVREEGEWRIVRESLATLVLTDKDVRHRRIVASQSRAPSAETGSRQSAGAATGALEVEEWRAIVGDEIDGIKIVGALANTGKEMALDVSLVVRLLSANGTPLGRARARLPRSGLEPGEEMGFEVTFPGVYEYDSVRFEPSSIDVVVHGEGPSSD